MHLRRQPPSLTHDTFSRILPQLLAFPYTTFTFSLLQNAIFRTRTKNTRVIYFTLNRIRIISYKVHACTVSQSNVKTNQPLTRHVGINIIWASGPPPPFLLTTLLTYIDITFFYSFIQTLFHVKKKNHFHFASNGRIKCKNGVFLGAFLLVLGSVLFIKKSQLCFESVPLFAMLS